MTFRRLYHSIYQTIQKMKLHLPVCLLSAVLSVATVAHAAPQTPKVSGTSYIMSDNTVQHDGSLPQNVMGTYTFSTNGDGMVTSSFVGKAGEARLTATPSKKTKYLGTVTGMNLNYVNAEGIAHKAASVDYTIGDGVTETSVSYASAGGIEGDYVVGDKTIKVTKGAYVGNLIGGSLLDTSYEYTDKPAGLENPNNGGIHFNPSTQDATITVKVVDGGKAGTIYGSHFIGGSAVNNGGTDADGYTNYKAKEKIVIEVAGAGTSVGQIIASYYGCVDNSVSIAISDGAEVSRDIYGGSIGYTNGAKGVDSYVESVAIRIEGDDTKVGGSIYAGGTQTSSAVSDVKEKSTVELAGGTVAGSVYGAGNGGTVGGSGSEIIIEGSGTQVGGTIYGGGTNGAVVEGERKLTVRDNHDSSNRAVGYKLADFTDVSVDGKIRVDAFAAADDGTEVTVSRTGAITTKAGVLTGLKSLHVDGGTLNIDMNDVAAGESGVSGERLTLGDGAIVNVMTTGSGASDAMQVFAFDSSNEDEKNFTLTMNGSLVDSELWGVEDGVLFIREASAATLNLNRNQSRFYNAAKAAAEADPENLALVELTTTRNSGAAKSAIDAMSGHEYATAMSSQIEGNLGHLRRLRSTMGKGEMLGWVTDDKMGTTSVSPWRAGVSVFHEEIDIDSDARGDGYNRNETGAMLNVEYLTGENVTLGGAVSYGRTRLSVDGARSRHEDNTRLDVYALYGKKRWSFATALGLGAHEHELLGDDVSGLSINFLQDAAYALLSREKDNVQVFGTIESSWNDIGSCSEGLISADGQDAWATDVTVGVRYNRSLRALGNAPAGVFSAQTGVTASIGDIKSGMDMSLGGFSYRQESATRNRWGWNMGAGVDVPVRNNVSVYGMAETVLRGDSYNLDGQIGVKVSF